MGGLTALAVVVVAYTLVASKLDRWWITGPMVFVAAGVILGPGGLDVLPVLAGQRDGPDHHRADPGPAAVRRCLDGPVEGCRGRCRSAPAAAVRRAAADDRGRRAAGLPDVSRRSGGRRQRWSPPSWRPPTRRSAWPSSPTSPCRCGSGGRSNVESGLNDGIATPFVTLFIAVVAAEEASRRHGLGARSAQADRAGARRRGRGRIPRREAAGRRRRTRLDLRGVRADRHPRPRAARLRGIRRDRRERLHRRVRRRASCSAPPPDAAWPNRSSSPRRSDCRPRSWSGRSSVRCSSESCSTRTSPLDRSSTQS